MSDEEWSLIGPLLPAERRRALHLPEGYGKWNSVFRRCRRWATTGVFDAMLERPGPVRWNAMVATLGV